MGYCKKAILQSEQLLLNFNEIVSWSPSFTGRLKHAQTCRSPDCSLVILRNMCGLLSHQGLALHSSQLK